MAFFCEHVAKPWPEWGQEREDGHQLVWMLNSASRPLKRLEFSLMNFPG